MKLGPDEKKIISIGFEAIESGWIIALMRSSYATIYCLNIRMPTVDTMQEGWPKKNPSRHKHDFSTTGTVHLYIRFHAD